MSKSKSDLTRRDLLQRGLGSVAAGAVLAAPCFVPATALGRDKRPAPSNRINLGVIGIGPRGTYDLKAMLKAADVQCLAVCDVQANRRQAAKKLVDEHYQNKDCAAYRDFHEILGRSDIDAVLIATGDRWHAAASMFAARAGKDVYSEKPCGLTIALCQTLDDTIRLTKRVFQAGTQRRSVTNFQTAVKLVHSGKLGKLHTVYASVYTPSIKTEWLPGEPTPAREVVDWDRWLGPAPWRPYNKEYVQGKWRGYWDFDSGARLLDWGAHTVDLCQWANNADETMPIEYRALPHPDHGSLRQRSQAHPGFPQDPLPGAARLGAVAGHLPGSLRRRAGLGRNGRQRRHRHQARVARARAEGTGQAPAGRGPGRLGPRPQLL